MGHWTLEEHRVTKAVWVEEGREYGGIWFKRKSTKVPLVFLFLWLLFKMGAAGEPTARVSKTERAD